MKKKKIILPKWFKKGCKVKFHGFGTTVVVLKIDRRKKIWVAKEGEKQANYPLDEVKKFWRPEKEWLNNSELRACKNTVSRSYND